MLATILIKSDALTGHDTDQIRITPSATKRHTHRGDLATVCSNSTTDKDSESEDEFRLDRDTVVSFVQDSLAEVVDRQKRNGDKNGREMFFYSIKET